MMLRIPRATLPQSVDTTIATPSTHAWRQFGLVLLCGAWVALGLIGRAPWKSEDAITFATAWEMLQRHDWLLPYLAHEPALSQSPLMPWLAAAGVTLFRPLLHAADAGRMAVGAVLVLTLLFIGLAGRELNGRTMRWMPVLLLIGSVGLFDRSHQLSQELALTMCMALALFAVSLSATRNLLGGALLGIAAGLAFLAAGWIGPLWTLLPALLLIACGPSWRARSYFATLALAFVVAAPLIAAWPLALYVRSPMLFDAWRDAQPFSAVLPFVSARGFDVVWLLRNIVWVAWPSFPLILWTLWIRARGFNGGMRDPAIIVPGIYASVLLLSIALLPESRLMQLLPALVPLALLASVEIDSMKREHSAALDWFGILTFGLTAIALWAFWIDAYINGMPPRIAMILRDSETGYGLSFNLRAFLAAALLSVLWVVLVRPARRSNRRAVLNWTAGITLIWGLVATIWMPYLDARRTYEPLGTALALSRPDTGCIARRNLGDPQRALFYYFGGLVTVSENAVGASGCPALLVQYGRLPDGTPQLDGYVVRWEGNRRGEASEKFVLYAKSKTGS
ncbi:MAG TPA: hypothetical protein VNG69_02405 [Casimicrobiaceae bacterium]|nr:hypothetical protein [Casimicrobiaceae bacterium]